MNERRYEVEQPIGPGWDELTCMRCGNEIEPEQEFVTAPFFPNSDDPIRRRAVGELHTWCAMQDGLLLSWPEGTSQNPLDEPNDSKGGE